MFAVSPIKYIGIKASKLDTGMVIIGVKAEGKCHKNKSIIKLTIIISSTNWCFSVSIARCIRSDLS